jgi:geranylgeranyl pyrophosphate synthase
MTVVDLERDPLRSTKALDSWFEPIHPEMEAVHLRLSNLASEHHQWLSEATRHILNAGGKRIRPAVCLLTAGHFGLMDERAVAFASGVELLHTATLVHDDVLDRAQTLRGAPTLHSNNSSNAAILVGDYLFARAADFIASIDDIQLMKLFALTLMTLVNGEISQHFTSFLLDRNQYDERIYAKTAAIFVLSTQGASLLGKADEEETQAFIDFGRHLGMAFQITDDILDFIGDPQTIGKPVGSDLTQGIPTLPLILYAQTRPEDPALQAMLQGEPIESETLQELIRRVRVSEAIEVARHEAQGVIDDAHQALRVLPESSCLRSLHRLADSCVERVDELTHNLPFT